MASGSQQSDGASIAPARWRDREPIRSTRGANATATPKMTGKMSLLGHALDGGIGLALASPKLRGVEKSSHLQRFAY
jgi:hypothetical protein